MDQSTYQKFIHATRYARWNEEENRRETWEETVDRYLSFIKAEMNDIYGYTIPTPIYNRLHAALLNMEIMPSMRGFASAGPWAKRDHFALYNCSALPVDNIRAFDETLYLLCNGSGVGYSVEKRFIEQLPLVPENLEDSDTIIVVEDSKEGWARGLKQLLSMLYAGEIPKWDTSKVRKKGARLKVAGGTASGPEPLIGLFEHIIEIFKKAVDRRLSSIECHSIMCMIGNIVIVGGQRRSALISLSNIDDFEMRKAKNGSWWIESPHFRLANNSAVYERKPEMELFLHEWTSLVESKSGERGIINRSGMWKKIAALPNRNHLDINGEKKKFLVNPCSEIILQPMQLCNLTAAVIRENDTPETLKEKVELATILGTFQAGLTNFRYVRKVWRDTCEEERLLGVCLTGQMDNKLMSGKGGWDKLVKVLEELRDHTHKVNKKYAEALGINVSAAITSCKPSGNSGELYGVASGIHPRFSEYYLRRVRVNKNSPLCQFFIDEGISNEDDKMSENDVVFSFPIKSPKNSVTRNDMNAIDQLEIWKLYANHWADHTISQTVYVKDDEWLRVGSWVFDNFDDIIGISFLPFDGGVYDQMPFEEIDAKEYIKLAKKIPEIDFTNSSKYETEDTTESGKEIACAGGACEI